MNFLKKLFASKEKIIEEKENYQEEDERTIAKELKELDKKVEEDTEHYYVEVTLKSSEVFKTDVFKPRYDIDPQWDVWHSPDRRLRYVRSNFYTSKEQAEQFVLGSSKMSLVRFGDEFICPKSVAKARLVKV